MSQLMCMMEVLKFNMYIINHTLLSTDNLGRVHGTNVMIADLFNC